jgi:predicted nuclease of predicted toxin-antitoxin system
MDCDDTEIWTYAQRNDYTIVTFDSDFYDFSVINGHPPKIIWVRSGNLLTKEIVQLLMKHKNSIEKFIESNDFQDISCLEID